MDSVEAQANLEAIKADMSQLRMNLTASKESRKRAELDAQLLANRIALLRQEEAKAWKKIDETRKRAEEINSLRAQNEQKYIQKEEHYKAKYENLRQNQAQNAYERDQARAKRTELKQRMVDEKRDAARAAKEAQNEYLMSRREKDAVDKNSAQSRSMLIKKQREEAKKKLEAEKIRKLEAFRAEYEAQVGQEEMLRTRTEALVAQMEKEEMELIQKLQNTQSVQRTAYEDLENALGGPGSVRGGASGSAPGRSRRGEGGAGPAPAVKGPGKGMARGNSAAKGKGLGGPQGSGSGAVGTNPAA